MSVVEKGKLIDAGELSQKVFQSDDTPTMKLYVDLLLLNAPAVDATTVVRCEYCESFGQYASGNGYCIHPNGLIDPKLSDFCSYGVRKDV